MVILKAKVSFDDIVYEYDKKNSRQLVYVALSRLILIRYLIIYACVDYGTYYKFYLKKNNNIAHLP